MTCTFLQSANIGQIRCSKWGNRISRVVTSGDLNLTLNFFNTVLSSANLGESTALNGGTESAELWRAEISTWRETSTTMFYHRHASGESSTLDGGTDSVKLWQEETSNEILHQLCQRNARNRKFQNIVKQGCDKLRSVKWKLQALMI